MFRQPKNSVLNHAFCISWKLCLNLFSRRLFNPGRSRFTPKRLWQPEMLFAVGLLNFNIFDLKMRDVLKFLIYSRQLWSMEKIITEKKNHQMPLYSWESWDQIKKSKHNNCFTCHVFGHLPLNKNDTILLFILSEHLDTYILYFV